MKLEALFLAWFTKFLETGWKGRDYTLGTPGFTSVDCNCACDFTVVSERRAEEYWFPWATGFACGALGASSLGVIGRWVASFWHGRRPSPRRGTGGVVRPPGWDDIGSVVPR